MGLLALARDVRTYLAANAPALGASVVIGRRQIAQQVNQGTGRANRVAFVIGDPSGKAGTYVGRQGSTERSGHPRQLNTLRALATVHVWAVDTTAPNDEEAQLEAAWALHDWAITAIHESARSPFALGDPEWVVDPLERPFGATLKFRLLVDVPVLHQRPALSVAGGTVSPVVANSLRIGGASEPSCSMGD